MSIFHNIYNWLEDAAYVWRQEVKQVFRDEGVLIFCVIVPLVYPLLYSWIYNNEVVHEVPVAVVDLSHSQQSRQFIRMCDASPDVRVAYYAEDLDDAQSLVSRQVVKGIYLIPEDFATRLNRMEQATVSVYCDMALMLSYKAFLTMVVPRLFHFLQLATWQNLLALMVPYVLACVFFGMTVSCLVRYRENVMLLVVFISLPC